MEQIRGYPYMRKKQLMEEFQVSRSVEQHFMND